MPELRQDPVTRRWVVIATERAKRPSSFTRAAKVAVQPSSQCPFCEGRESMTPPEVMAYRAPGTAPDTPGWEVRVVPNLYPAFGPASGSLDPVTVGPYRRMNGLGVHEVIINGPDHEHDLGQLPVAKVAQIVQAYTDRIRAHRTNPLLQYLLVIVNHGKEAGASLEHPHAQLFGIPLVPPTVEEEVAGLARYRAEHGECAYCAILAYEREVGERVVYENEGFVVLSPYAARTPFETWILPKEHQPNFEDLDERQRWLFAEALQTLTSRLYYGLNDPPFNFYIHTRPTQSPADYHWHLELLPKLAIAAGFELGTGIMINTVLPEAAAEFLRSVQPGEAVSVEAPPLHR